MAGKGLYAKSETGCCKRFDPKPWDGKLIAWKGKLFLRAKAVSFFYVPLNMDKVMASSMERIAKANALAKVPIMLCDCRSCPFTMDIFIAVEKSVPGAQMERVSGDFLMKVFEGDFSQHGKWARGMEEFVKRKGKKIKRMYTWYTTCPKCAKHYGKNYVVMVAQV